MQVLRFFPHLLRGGPEEFHHLVSASEVETRNASVATIFGSD